MNIPATPKAHLESRTDTDALQGRLAGDAEAMLEKFPAPWRRVDKGGVVRFLDARGNGIAITDPRSANDILWSGLTYAVNYAASARATLTPTPTDAGTDKAAPDLEAVARDELYVELAYCRHVDLPISEIVDRVIKFFASHSPAPQWQGIESAPRDGTAILVAHPLAGVCESWCLRDGGEWYCIDGTNLVPAINNAGVQIGMRPGLTSFVDPPTHWTPLPQAPTTPTGNVSEPDQSLTYSEIKPDGKVS